MRHLLRRDDRAAPLLTDETALGAKIADGAAQGDPALLGVVVVEVRVLARHLLAQPAHGRGLAVIDDGEDGFALVAHALVTVDGLAKYLLVELACQPKLTIEILIPTGVAAGAETERPQ